MCFVVSPAFCDLLRYSVWRCCSSLPMMNSLDSYVRKTCKSCLEDVKIYTTCSTCDAAYHIYCINQVPGAYVNPQGQLFCCGNITSKQDGSRKMLRTEDDPLQKVKEENNQDDYKEDLENCLPDEDSERKKFECESCYLVFTKKEHLEGHYNECPYIIQGGLIQEINRDKELKNCLHKEEDLEWTEFKCDAYPLELTNEEHLQNHYSDCPDKQRGLLQELDKDKAGPICSFCSGETFQEESYEQHIKRCEEYYSELNKGSDGYRISKKRKQAHIRTNKRLLKCNKCDYVTKRRHLLTYHNLSKHYDGKKSLTHIEYTLERHLRTRISQKPYKCNRCDYRTALKRSLNTHMKIKHSIHTNKRPSKGDICNYSDIHRKYLNRRILAKHSNPERKYRCSDCKYSTHQKRKCDACGYAPIQKTGLDRHILAKDSDAEKKYKCSDCEYATHNKSHLVSHMYVHTTAKLFKCDTCDFSSTWKVSLWRHILLKHSNVEKKYKCNNCEYSTHLNYRLTDHILTHSNERPFKCDTCNYATAWKAKLKKHTLARHSNAEKKYKCSDCKYSAHQKSDLVNHTCIYTNEKPYKCNTCGYTATQKTSLNHHILAKHSNAEKKYKCSDCKYSTHLKWNLVIHIRIHANEKTFKCDTCDYAATHKTSLDCHILTKHSNAEKQYKCSDCKYSTYQKSRLVNHTRIHTNEKPFKCDTCNFATAWKTKLKNHTLAKHSNAEKKYKCSDCKYSTFQKWKLVNHIRIHTNEKPFKCDSCDYAATQKVNLNRHTLAKHSNAEKNYKCSNCEYSTHIKSNLASHTRTHTNEKPYKCDTCTYTATQRDRLDFHILVKHANAEKKY